MKTYFKFGVEVTSISQLYKRFNIFNVVVNYTKHFIVMVAGA